jgi:hypothetical protein
MDFVERWFGLSPDGGSGTFEACVIFAMIACVLAVTFRRRLGRLTANLVERFSRRWAREKD